MNKQELKLRLQPFVERCEQENINIADIIIEEAYPGMSDYNVDVCIPDLNSESYNDILDKTYGILLETMDDEILYFIFTFCIVNDCEEIRSCPVNTKTLAEI